MLKYIFTLLLIAGCTHTTEKKEWNDRYNPSEGRKQFEKCKTIHYAPYPEEIILDEWRKCMDEKDYG